MPTGWITIAGPLDEDQRVRVVPALVQYLCAPSSAPQVTRPRHASPGVVSVVWEGYCKSSSINSVLQQPGRCAVATAFGTRWSGARVRRTW
jgi:hypothetical protein